MYHITWDSLPYPLLNPQFIAPYSNQSTLCTTAIVVVLNYRNSFLSASLGFSTHPHLIKLFPTWSCLLFPLFIFNPSCLHSRLELNKPHKGNQLELQNTKKCHCHTHLCFTQTTPLKYTQFALIFLLVRFITSFLSIIILQSTNQINQEKLSSRRKTFICYHHS